MIKDKYRLLLRLKNTKDNQQPKSYSFLRKRDKQMIQKYYSKEQIWIELLKQAEKLHQQFQYSEALRIYKNLLGFDLDNRSKLMIKMNIGKVYQQTGDIRSAIECYIQIINTAPKIIFIYNRLLLLLNSLRQQQQQEHNMMESFLLLIEVRNLFKNIPKTIKFYQYQFNYAIALKRMNKLKAKYVLQNLLFKISNNHDNLLLLIKKQLFQIYEDLKLFSQARRLQKQLRQQGITVDVGIENVEYYQKIQQWRKVRGKQNRFKFKSIDKIDKGFVIRNNKSKDRRISIKQQNMRSCSEKSYQFEQQKVNQNSNEQLSKLELNTGKIEVVDQQQQIRLYTQLQNYKQPKVIDFQDHPIVVVTSPQISPQQPQIHHQPQLQLFINVCHQPISPILPPSLRKIKTESNTHSQKDKSQLSFSNPSGKTPFQTLYPETLMPIEPISIPIRRQSKLSLFSNSRQNYEFLASQIQSSLQPKFNRSNKKSLTLSSYTPSSGSYQMFNALNYAINSIEKQNYKKAKSYLKKSLNDEENDRTIVYNLLGDCYQKLQKYQTALSCWNKILNTGQCQVFLKIQRVNRKINRMTSSIPILKQGLERFPKEPKLFEKIGWIYLELNEIQRGLNYLQKAHSLDYKSYSIKVKLAYAYFLKPSTLQLCKQIIHSLHQNIQQPNQTLKILLSHVLHFEQDPSQSLLSIKKLYQDDELNQNYLYLAGKTSMLANDLKSAFQFLKKSITINPTKIQSHTLISTILCAYGYSNQALQILKQCLKVVKSPQIYQLCGKILYVNKQFIEAIKYYKQSFSMNHKNHLLNSIADCYHHLKKHNNSIIYYRKSLSIQSNQPNVYKALAFLYQHVSQPNKSIKYFEKCIDEYKMNDYEILFGRAKSYILRKEYGQCILFLQQLLETNQNKDVCNNLGFCYYSMGSFCQAIQMYIKFLQYQSNSEVYFNIGVCFNKINDLDNAERYYLKCIESDNNHCKALYNYAIILFYRKQLKCVQMIEKALRIEQKQDIIRLDGNQLVNNEDNYVVLAEMYSEFSMFEKVIKLCECVFDHFDIQKFYYFMIKGYLMIDEIEKASFKYQEFCSKYPNSADILRIDALIKERQNK